jgi:lipopolysaccharide export system ATP-binding protein
VIDIQNIIHQLRSKGIGVVISDHNVRETLGVCDRAYILNEGKILEEGKPAQIANNKKVKSIYLGEEFRL